MFNAFATMLKGLDNDVIFTECLTMKVKFNGRPCFETNSFSDLFFYQKVNLGT